MSKSTTKPKRHKIRAHMVALPRKQVAMSAGDASFENNSGTSFGTVGTSSGAGAIAASAAFVDVSSRPVDRGPLPDSLFRYNARHGKLPIEQIVSRRLAVRRFVRVVVACGQRVPVRFVANF